MIEVMRTGRKEKTAAMEGRRGLRRQQRRGTSTLQVTGRSLVQEYAPHSIYEVVDSVVCLHIHSIVRLFRYLRRLTLLHVAGITGHFFV